MVGTLTDVLLEMLDLDLVYVSLSNPSGEAPLELVRFAHWKNPMPEPHEVVRELHQCLGAVPRSWPASARGYLGNDEFSFAPMRLGLEGEIGFIVAGVQRPDFPGATESLLFRVAANQIVIGLHEGWVLNEQKRLANELDKRVAQRTRELAEANEGLRKEILERARAEEKLRCSEAFLGSSRRVGACRPHYNSGRIDGVDCARSKSAAHGGGEQRECLP